MASPAVVLVPLQHGAKRSSVAMYAGMRVEELATVFRSLFGLASSAIALVSNDGVVVPLSVACSVPSILSAHGYTILLEDAAPIPLPVSAEDPPPPYEEAETFYANASAPPPHLDQQTQFPMPEDQPLPSTLASINAQNFSKLLKFFTIMRGKKLLLKEEAAALEELVFDDNLLLHAAFSVAESAKDADYLAVVCKDIGQSVLTEPGRATLAAQEDLLFVCDALFRTGQVTENQLLYLRHLVLVRDEVVASIYEEYKDDANDAKLARLLLVLANTHPAQSEEVEEKQNATERTATERTPEISSQNPQFSPPAKVSKFKNLKTRTQSVAKAAAQNTEMEDVNEEHPLWGVLGGVVAALQAQGMLTEQEVNILKELVEEEDAYVVGACELYTQDGRLAELLDTLTRKVRHEAKRRTEMSAASGALSPSVTVELTLKQRVASLLASLGVEDGWDDQVPLGFMVCVFASAQAKVLSIPQACTLCDLYAAGYDLVCACWEVFRVQGDEQDLIDTLVRIVRDLKFSYDEMVEQEGTATVPASSGKEGHATKELSSTTESVKEQLEQTRKAAQKANADIMKAKLDLLQQTLELMCKQRLVGPDNAAMLIMRAKGGDVMVDRAIEAYAHDRDVIEFVDTLQILANNEEELQGIEKQGQVGQEETKDLDTKQRDEDKAQVEMTDLVQLLHQDGKISSRQKAVLARLLSSNDERLLAAHDVYLQFQDVDDLIDSILRVANREIRTGGEQSKDDHGIEMSVLGNTVPEAVTPSPKPSPKNTAATARKPILGPSDHRQIVQILVQDGVISSELEDVLLELLQTDDQNVKQVFDAYEENKDVYVLIDGLKREAQAFEMKQLLANKDDEEDEREDMEGNNDDEDGDDEASVDDLVRQKFYDVVRSSRLSELETAALRYALSVDNEHLRAALSVFRLENDEADLAHTLRLIARRVIADMQANEAQEETKDTLPDLLATFSAQNLLNTQEVGKLLDLYEGGDDVMHAAVAVHRSDGNTEELLDTLKRMCKPTYVHVRSHVWSTSGTGTNTGPAHLVSHRVRDAEVIQDMAEEADDVVEVEEEDDATVQTSTVM